MEDPTATINDVDAAPDVVAQKTWDETIQDTGGLDSIGAGLSAVGKPLQSTNFVEGQSGWRINSNGDAEFNSIAVRGSSSTLPIQTNQVINGVVPKPVIITSAGDIVIADANDSALDDFFGFVTDDNTNTVLRARHLNGTEATTSTTISHTLNAGVDRIIIFHWQAGSVGSSNLPTSVTWNGNNMTNLADLSSGYPRLAIWYYIAGTSTAATTADVVITGGSNQKAVFIDNYEYVDQASPFQDTDTTISASGTSCDTDVTSTQGHSLFVQHYADFLTGYNQTMGPGFTNLHLDSAGDHNGVVAYAYLSGIKNYTITSSTNFGSYDANNTGLSALLVFKNSKTSTVEVTLLGIVSGFSGLTIGADYYLSDTAGEISTTPGSTSVLLGKAISADKLFIINT